MKTSEFPAKLTVHTPLNEITFANQFAGASIYEEILKFLSEEATKPYLIIETNLQKIIYTRKCLENSIIIIEEKESE